VLVVGASGRLGGRIARLLLRRGERVTVLARPTSDLGDLEARGAVALPGDLCDPGSLIDACALAGAVVVTATAARRDPPDTPRVVDDEGVRSLIDAAVLTGVRRFVLVSADIARPDSSHAFLRAKASAERHLRASSLDFTILAPDMFMESWVGAVVTEPADRGDAVVLVDGAPAHAFVSETDVASIADAVLGARWTIGRRLPVGGPEVLGWDDVVGQYALRRGRPVDVQRLTPAEARARPGPSAMLLEPAQAPPALMRLTADRLGVPLTSLADFLGLLAR
jgi:uncharacterized protein YbjT (DUF2867 family)